ncbi:hypothetical protein FE257_006090 [Aspergillus nanangensis]|uniref:Protein-lysine N-methyltransferase EFM4 n=1 Tax=Aspergillus nanangensis TaxID=2582783 RepID=A0AAD4CA08_ASPNN|nr:hypothetical protein FE257_006090 [Aspergillus nanangensis]
MADESHPTHLSPSELGTKDYWETFYARTLSHISSKPNPSSTAPPQQQSPPSHDDEDDDDEEDEIDDDDDPGTSWFSEHNAPDKVLQFLTAEDFPLAPCNTLAPTPSADDAKPSPQQPSILDLGTGNGSMLALLRKRGGFAGVMVGVDYSPRSVELARELQRLKIHSAYLSDSEDDNGDDGDDDDDNDNDNNVPKGSAGVDPDIRFEEWDILHSTDALTDATMSSADRGLDWFPYTQGGFDIVLDKGTFDAVSLSDEVVGSGDTGATTARTVQRRVCETYPGVVRRLVRKGGFVVVTSCNWTEEELIRWFTSLEGEEEKDRLVVWGRVEYPRFRFGGKEGQGVCTVCFQRV